MLANHGRREVDAEVCLGQLGEQIARAFRNGEIAQRAEHALVEPPGHQEAAAPGANMRQRRVAPGFARVIARIDQPLGGVVADAATWL